jgi:hypothetical protein
MNLPEAEKAEFNLDDPNLMIKAAVGMGFARMGVTGLKAVMLVHPFGATLRVDQDSQFHIVTQDGVVGQGKGLLALETKLFQMHLVKGKDGIVGGKI